MINTTKIELLQNIENHNDKIYNEYKPTEKIDFSRTKKNWGTDVIPAEFWIDVTKKYKTRNGHEVQLHKKVLYSNGKEMTFPIKGTYITQNPKKIHYNVWTLDGRSNVNKIENSLDLIFF